jgi:hypothetical protein
MHCSYLSVSSLCIVIDDEEQGCEEPLEPAPVEDANLERDQGNPGASSHIPWALLIFVFYLWSMNVH